MDDQPISIRRRSLFRLTATRDCARDRTLPAGDSSCPCAGKMRSDPVQEFLETPPSKLVVAFRSLMDRERPLHLQVDKRFNA